MMLSDQELEQLLSEIESDRAERKSALSDKDRVCEAVCAFSNDLAEHRRPGVVFVGVNDDGTPAGLPITDRLLQDLAAIRSDGHVLPIPTLAVQKRVLRGAEVAVVEVEPASSPPVRYKGRTYIRVGPRRAIATRDEERRLSEKRLSADLPFDQRAAVGATVADLDTLLFERSYLPSAVSPEVLEANDRTLEQKLTALRFLTPQGVPNNAALLVLGTSPRDWIPGAYVQFVRYEGTDVTAPIRHQSELSGALPDLLADIDRILEANVSISTVVAGGDTESRQPDYPLSALQQLVRNAVMHRNYETSYAPAQVYWYADRIEIANPGGPFGRVTTDTFGQPGLTDYRNPLIAEAMKVLGYVQRFGMGLTLARRELERNGNPSWTYQGRPESTLLVVRRRP